MAILFDHLQEVRLRESEAERAAYKEADLVLSLAGEAWHRLHVALSIDLLHCRLRHKQVCLVLDLVFEHAIDNALN